MCHVSARRVCTACGVRQWTSQGSVDPRLRTCIGFAKRAFLEGTGWSLMVPTSPGSTLPDNTCILFPLSCKDGEVGGVHRRRGRGGQEDKDRELKADGVGRPLGKTGPQLRPSALTTLPPVPRRCADAADDGCAGVPAGEGPEVHLPCPGEPCPCLRPLVLPSLSPQEPGLLQSPAAMSATTGMVAELEAVNCVLSLWPL